MSKKNLSDYVCKHCGSDLLIDYEYHQNKGDGPASRIPLEELSVYCEDENECGEAGQFDEIAISRKEWEKQKGGN